MIANLRDTHDFRAYERARDAVLRIKGGLPDAGAGAGVPSAYWAEELENIDYLVDASPLIVRKLRHHAFHITGIRPYDYRTKADPRRENFENRLRALLDLGPSLYVPESRALGGFGYEIDGRVANVDTLKFFEVLVGMERGGVLRAVRERERPVVCEIGAGWGGFAYQFKTLFPKTTYVIVDFPELFLFSATYLGATFPDARVHFVEHGAASALDGAQDADFVFVPHTLSHLVSTLPLDVTANMVSFQEMTDAQVRGYAEMAAAAGCPLLYSLNRDRSPYNDELVSVSAALGEVYQLTEVPVLRTDYTSAMKKPPKPGTTPEVTEYRYRHLVGRLPGGMAGTRTRAQRTETPATSSATLETAAGTSVARRDGPRVVLGMTLYNKARYLPEALDSLLAQTFGDFALVMLDDASDDDTAAVAAAYASRDPRVRFHRHGTRAAMIATWREVAELAYETHPQAEFFAWVSDHDRWHPRWLESLVAQLDADPGAVLAYPVTRRIDEDGRELGKGPRVFDTAGETDLRGRWLRFCRDGIGSGDMVYGLQRMDALRRAGIFRLALRPDRLLIAELTLFGRILQTPEVLWFRRNVGRSSIERQEHTLVLPGRAPWWFRWPPSLQHGLWLAREYVGPRRFGLSAFAWLAMLARYEITYGWRHFRKSRVAKAVERTAAQTLRAKRMAIRLVRRAVYESLMALREWRGQLRRQWRLAIYHAGRARERTAWLAAAAGRRARGAALRAVYHVAVFTHRTGLRRRDEAPPG